MSPSEKRVQTHRLLNLLLIHVHCGLKRHARILQFSSFVLRMSAVVLIIWTLAACKDDHQSGFISCDKCESIERQLRELSNAVLQTQLQLDSLASDEHSSLKSALERRRSDIIRSLVAIQHQRDTSKCFERCGL